MGAGNNIDWNSLAIDFNAGLGGGTGQDALGNMTNFQDFYGIAGGGGTNTPAGWSDLSLPGKVGVIGQGLGAFSTLANLYGGFKALDLQKDAFRFQKNAWNKNYANQVKDYENTLKDRWAARAAGARARGQDFENMAAWLGPRLLTGELAPGARSQQSANPMSGFGLNPATYQNQAQNAAPVNDGPDPNAANSGTDRRRPRYATGG